MPSRIDQLLEVMNNLVTSVLPDMEQRIYNRIERRLSDPKIRSRIVLFDGSGPPPIPNPSLRATYQSRANGSRWWWTGSQWKSIGV